MDRTKYKSFVHPAYCRGRLVHGSNTSCPDTNLADKIISNTCSDRFNLFNMPTLADPPRPPNTKSPTVTLQQLRHAVPGKAQKEMEKARQAIQSNHADEAIGHLEKAVLIDPEFVGARNDLAVMYMRTNKVDPAIEQLNAAIKLDPNFTPLFVNLAIGHVLHENFSAAEQAARGAMDLDRVGTVPRYLLVVSLIYQKTFSDEALRLARRVSDQYPLAHLFAGRVLLSKSDFEGARSEINAYLSGGSQMTDFTTVATSWLGYIASHERQAISAIP